MRQSSSKRDVAVEGEVLGEDGGVRLQVSTASCAAAAWCNPPADSTGPAQLAQSNVPLTEALARFSRSGAPPSSHKKRSMRAPVLSRA